MAKRFTDTNKYKKSFYRRIPGAYKLLWDFLYHDCDNAGIWIIDFDIAQTYVGKDMLITREQAVATFNSDEVRIVEFDNMKKWFIPSFITFQYGKLSEKNRAHLSVISVLQKYDFLNSDFSLKNFPKAHISPLQGAKDKDMEMDMAKAKDKEQDFGKSENLSGGQPALVPQMFELWIKSFPKYTANKKFDYPPLRDICDFIFTNSGTKNTYGDTDAEIKCLNTFQLIADQVNREPFWVNKSLSTISKHIQEFYNKIKNPINGKRHKSAASNSVSRESLNDLYNKRFTKRGQDGTNSGD